jgi:leucyl/phenylalanyl-tRNA--protein transferase
VTADLPDPWRAVTLGAGLGVPVAIGGEITPAAILWAYRRGLFCQPRSVPAEIAEYESLYGVDVRAGDVPVLSGDGNPYAVTWWSPRIRYYIPVAGIKINRSLRATLRRCGWTATADLAFDRVITACRNDRSPTWLTDELVSAMCTLHADGWAHSVEVWEADDLVGGLFGCAIGKAFVLDSGFHCRPDAVKAAVIDLASRCAAAGLEILDTQVRSEYTIRLGATSMRREEYLSYVAGGSHPVTLKTNPAAIARFAPGRGAGDGRQELPPTTTMP